MRAKVEVGGFLDIATPYEVREILEHSLARNRPYLPHIKGSSIMPSTGVGIVYLGFPQVGRVWDVRHISVSGGDPTVSVPGRALVCIGQIPSSQQIRGADPIDPLAVWTSTNCIPADASFDRHEGVVHHQDTLYVVFSGVASGTQLAAHAQIVDERENQEATYPA